MSVDDAIRNHVFQRLKKEALGKMEVEMGGIRMLGQVKTYKKYMGNLEKIAMEHLEEYRPRHIKISEVSVRSK